MESALPKQYLSLAGRAVLARSIDCLAAHPAIHGTVLVLGRGDRHWPALEYRSAKPIWLAEGGADRQASVLNGLLMLARQSGAGVSPSDWVLVHDAVRPCLQQEDLNCLLDSLAEDPVGGILAVPVRDTLKRADSAQRIAATVDRTALWHAQTPQMFRLEMLTRALQSAAVAGTLLTDEAAAIEAMGLMPKLVEGSASNIKITRPGDLRLAEQWLASHAHQG